MSRQTGGATFDVSDVAAVGDVYRRIRKILDREATLYYTPPSTMEPTPAGGHRATRGRQQQRKGVTVRVRSLRHGCRLETARSDWRQLSQLVATRSLMFDRPVVASPSDSSEDRCLSFQQRMLPNVTSGRWVSCQGDLWTASLDDITRDAGMLYDPDARKTPPRWRVRPDRPIRREGRLAVFDWPPAEKIKTDRADLEAWFGAWDADGEKAASFDWIHGGTLLDLQYDFADALAARDDYRRWAEQRLHRDWVEETLANLLASTTVDPVATREILSGVDREAPAYERTRYLAAWLGDYDLREAFEEIERARLNRALQQGFDPVVPPDAERWREIFPVPTGRRLIAPTRLVYDPAGERFGFFRIRLPMPREARPPLGRLPPQALAFAWFKSLGLSPGEGAFMEELEYLTLPRKTRRYLQRTTEGSGRHEEDWWMVHLGWRQGDQLARAHLFFDSSGFDSGIPVCVDRLGFEADGMLPVGLENFIDCSVDLPHTASSIGVGGESRMVFPVGRSSCSVSGRR